MLSPRPSSIAKEGRGDSIIDRLFACDGGGDITGFSEPDQSMNFVTLRESLCRACLVFIDTTREIIRHTDIKCPIAIAGEDVDVITSRHIQKSTAPGYRDKPGMTDEVEGVAQNTAVTPALLCNRGVPGSRGRRILRS